MNNKKQEMFKPKRGQVPTRMCSNCTHCSQKYCNVHARPVDTSFNRCFYHSDYQPNAGVFKVSSGLENIMAIEEEANKKHQKGWLLEHNKMVAEMQKEIDLAKNLGKTA